MWLKVQMSMIFQPQLYVQNKILLLEQPLQPHCQTAPMTLSSINWHKFCHISGRVRIFTYFIKKLNFQLLTFKTYHTVLLFQNISSAPKKNFFSNAIMRFFNNPIYPLLSTFLSTLTQPETCFGWNHLVLHTFKALWRKLFVPKHF